jgi:hypothetical protein
VASAIATVASHSSIICGAGSVAEYPTSLWLFDDRSRT